jgi:hypothetical protein
MTKNRIASHSIQFGVPLHYHLVAEGHLGPVDNKVSFVLFQKTFDKIVKN